MLFNGPQDTKELIITTLSQGSISSVELQRLISEKRHITKQAFYKALRELMKDEIIIKNQKLLVLNNLWINKMYGFIASIDSTHGGNKSLIELGEGDSTVHHFNSLTSLNQLWMHYFFIMAKKVSDEQIIFYNKHNFWTLFRNESENFMFKWIKEHNRKAYFVIGENTLLDRKTTTYVQDFEIDTHYETKSSFEKNHYSITVIGDYILDTVLDMNTANAIDALYRNNKVWSEEVSEQLTAILKNLKRSKVVIERNKKKAELLRKKLMKYFVFV
jgi:hypothetical protein